ncbi:unnamed protein product [Euphydryas editha]|uniref:Uncharacterized protein n=1 Tax=Euphydryas editha TaxID=104508 RepID=A0AAU9V8P9_EUPED|nr:unnamed protein product [Euphydryas editha]
MSLNLAYNRNYPSEVNYQRQNPIIKQPVKTSNEPYLVHREANGLGIQEISHPLIMTEVPRLKNEGPKRDNIIVRQSVPFEYLHSQPFRKIDKLPLEYKGDVNAPLRFYESPSIPINAKGSNRPFESEGLRSELKQSAPPEYIKSIIEQRPFEQKHPDPSRTIHSHPNVDDLKYSSSEPDYKNHTTATFQNPSAESLYKLQQALPYTINTQLFLNKTQGNTYLNNVLNSRRIQDIYRTEKPKKRYTIIHPDGRIEEFDHVEGFIEKNPNYILIKSEDIMKQFQGGLNVTPNGQVPARSNTNIPTTTNKEQTNDLQQVSRRNYDFKDINNTVNKQDINNMAPIEQNASAISETNIEKIDVNTSDLTTINSTFLQNEKNYSTKPTKSELTTLPTKNQTENNSTSVNASNVENSQPQQFQNNTELTTSEIEYQNVIASNVLFNSSYTTVAPIIDDNNFKDISINTTETAFTNENITLNTEQEISSNANGNNIQNLQITKESNNDLVTSPVYSTQIPNNENTTENSAFWFQADEQFWDKLIYGNSSRNSIYFFFVPPRANIEKKTKTIAYPNGTIVEEVTETITDDDGVPKIFKSTTITHNATSDCSEK